VPLIVVGAGPAGLAAALTAAKAGIETLIVDEHPVAGALMGLDVPFHFGGRMSAAVQQKARMVEQLVETNPGLAEAFERGIAVELGTYVWGAFARGPTVRALPRPMLGVADDERSWLVSFDRLVVAAGARDLAIGFAGWEKPGVMGAQAFLTLANAIQKSNGSRTSIAQHLYSQNFPTGLIGAFKIDATGDPSLGGVTVDKIVKGVITPLVVVNPPAALATKALG